MTLKKEKQINRLLDDFIEYEKNTDTEKALFYLGSIIVHLDENKLKELMLDAQEQTYGDGLDKDIRHPYMWLWKPHYYSAGLSFYNWPYAFGLLFAKGLYGIYQKEGKLFATPIAGKGSGDLANLVEADAFLELPDDSSNFTKGTIFPLITFR